MKKKRRAPEGQITYPTKERVRQIHRVSITSRRSRTRETTAPRHSVHGETSRVQTSSWALENKGEDVKINHKGRNKHW